MVPSVVVRQLPFFWGKTAEAFAMPLIRIFSTCGTEVLKQNNREEKTLVIRSVGGHRSGIVDAQVETSSVNARTYTRTHTEAKNLRLALPTIRCTHWKNAFSFCTYKTSASHSRVHLRKA